MLSFKLISISMISAFKDILQGRYTIFLFFFDESRLYNKIMLFLSSALIRWLPISEKSSFQEMKKKIDPTMSFMFFYCLH